MSVRKVDAAPPGAMTPEELLPLVYERLRRLAHRYMRRERSGHTLSPTAVVHEAYMRLVSADRIRWRGKDHFFAIAASEMRRVLVEYARTVGASKRGGDAMRVRLSDEIALVRDRSVDLLALDQALRRLARLSPRQARVVELHVFAGMPFHQIAAVLGVSERTASGDWRMGRTWLARQLRLGGAE